MHTKLLLHHVGVILMHLTTTYLHPVYAWEVSHGLLMCYGLYSN